jgi:hypothetical protein
LVSFFYETDLNLEDDTFLELTPELLLDRYGGRGDFSQLSEWFTLSMFDHLPTKPKAKGYIGVSDDIVKAVFKDKVGLMTHHHNCDGRDCSLTMVILVKVCAVSTFCFIFVYVECWYLMIFFVLVFVEFV